MQSYFYSLIDFVNAKLAGDEAQLANFFAEESDFVRFNRSAVRQAGRVEQRNLDLTLIKGQRHATQGVVVTGELATDRSRLTNALHELREQLKVVPEDPFLFYSTQVVTTESLHPKKTDVDRRCIVDAIAEAGLGRDLVGILAIGGIHRGFANSLGQRNWFSTYNHHFDWSFHLTGDKAVKGSYAGAVWDHHAFREKIDASIRELEVLGQPATTIAPGNYRVYLAPSALAEIVDMLAWGGFGLTAHRTRQTPLLRMISEGARLHASVEMVEDAIGGTGANFDGYGFIKPDRVVLIRAGEIAETLVSPRAAREYGVETNAASRRESPESLVMAGGSLPRSNVLEQLNTGIFVNNLWYLNYSDRGACRMTGMTRFATFWVEGGNIQAPLNVMRFDESIYRMLGTNLLGLTRETDLLMDSNTYHSRSTSSVTVPGALIDDFTLTL